MEILRLIFLVTYYKNLNSCAKGVEILASAISANSVKTSSLIKIAWFVIHGYKVSKNRHILILHRLPK